MAFEEVFQFAENGELVGRAKESRLVTVAEDFDDCEVRIECKLAVGANSGLHVRTVFGDGWRSDYKAQLSNDPQWETLTGGISRHAPRLVPIVGDDEWFELRFCSQGRQLDVSVNGKQASQISLPSEGLRTVGAIGLQSWTGDEVRFRKIEVRRLNRQSR